MFARSLAAFSFVALAGASVAVGQVPIAVVRFAAVTTAPGRVRVEAGVERPDGRIVSRVLREVAGPCVEDVGGLESLAVLTCAERRFEVVQRGLRVEVLEWDVARDRRVARHALFTARRGWVVTPRCRETADDPRACLPAR